MLNVINAICGLYSSEILSLLDIVDYQFLPLIMPRCVGLPTGPCPNGRNDSYMRNGEGDLMLCPDCDSARFQEWLANRDDEPAYTKVDKPNKGKKQECSVTAKRCNVTFASIER